MEGVISLEGLQFHAPIGFYDYEREEGNDFEVDVFVHTTFDGVSDDLTKTVNYENIYALVESIILQPRKLIETVASELLKAVLAQFPQVSEVKISVYKLSPPITGECKRAGVHVSRKRA